MSETSSFPSRGELVAELKLLREKGLPELDELELPALGRAATYVAGEGGSQDEAAAIEAILRRVAGRVGGGRFGDALVALFGLDGNTRALTAGVRRSMAADILGVSLKTFLRKHEGPMINQVARLILALCTEQQQREGRIRLAAAHPVESSLAVHWIERFEAYYRLWTPIYALAADLTAYRSTLLENPRPYDRRYGTESSDDPGHSQEEQAEGYARYALAHYARFEWGLRRFLTQHGGLWMLSEPRVEQDVADAVYRISWHVNPFNERDQSFLRTLVDETPNQELHSYLERLAGSELGCQIEHEWLEWCASCECVWDQIRSTDDAYFPSARTEAGISNECQVHSVIEACGRYCELVDLDWQKIADWYHLDDTVRTERASAERLYSAWRRSATSSLASARLSNSSTASSSSLMRDANDST